MAAGPRVFEILDEKPVITNKPEAVELRKGAGAIELRDVNYDFSDGQPALRDLNIRN